MKISYNEFHIGREVRNLCDFNKRLYASSGNVIFTDIRSVRLFAEKLNELFDKRGEHEKRISAGSLNAMGLIDEIFHYICMLYRKEKKQDAFSSILEELDEFYGKNEIDKLLIEFSNEFPPVAVYQGELTAEEYLLQTALDSGTGVMRSNREQTLEEIILLHLANENPAFNPFAILFNDDELEKNRLYQGVWAAIQKAFKKLPEFGPFNNDLITMLREPVMFSPNSLKGQLDYIRKYWMPLLAGLRQRLLMGIDTISEEEKLNWHSINGGDVNIEPYNYESLMKEYERFSPDKEWMPCVILMAKTVLVWLDQLTKKYKRAITRLDQIPDEELDTLRDQGFTGLWLIGLWERSYASKRVKQICGNPEAAASAYSLYDYNIAENIGGWDALSDLRSRLWQRGIRLASDMVPNHTGMDSSWVINKPDLFIQRRDAPSPTYSFNGENLSQDSRVGVYLEDHYYSRSDCSVVFKRVDFHTGDTRYIYHGNDGTGMPWNDTAQIDFLNPQAREEVMQEILHVARNFPIIRFDAAMVLAKKHIRRLWYPEPGCGGDIYTRSETGLSTQQFNDAIPNEFWREVVDRIAKEVPDTLLLAEAFWMMEGYFVRTLGMHRVYNSAFMNMLKKEENQKYRDTVKNTIKFDPQILKRYVNFMNNPDEETAEAQFGKGDKYFGVCTLMVTMPGLPMFGHGQIEGFTEKYGMEFTKAYRNEVPDQDLINRHKHDIFPIMKKRYIFANVDNFLFYDVWDNGCVNENIFAYSNRCGNESALVFYNNKYDRAQGWIKQSCEYAVKNNGNIEMHTKSISEGLGLSSEDNKFCIFREHRTGLWFIRSSKEICDQGMFTSLNGFEYQVLMDIHQVEDTHEHRYQILCDSLQGRGSYDLEVEWQEISYKNLYSPLEEFVKPFMSEFHKIISDSIKGNSDSVSVKKLLKELVADYKKEATDFFRIANNFAGSRYNLASADEQFATFEKIIEMLAKAASSKKRKPSEDISIIFKNVKDADSFLLNAFSNNFDILDRIACYAILKEYAQAGLAESWGFARKINGYLQPEYKNGDLYNDLLRIFVLSKNINKDKIIESPKQAAYEIVKLMTQDGYAALLSGVNVFNEIAWFNKEISDLNLILAAAITVIELPEYADNIIKFYSEINDAKTKAEYKCKEFIKPFVPEEINTEDKTKNKVKNKKAKK